MPTLGRDDHDRALVLDAERRHRFGLGLRHGRNLDGLTLAVEPVELAGKPRGLDLILMQKRSTPSVARPMRPPALMRGRAESPGARAPAAPTGARHPSVP